jgi:exosortase/archaeosortase family protein
MLLTCAFAVLVRRPLGERLLILLSTVPIALVCNIARITVTGILYVLVGEKWANLVFHDLAGWLMMPLALLLLWLELKLMSVLFIDETPDEQPTFRLPGTPLRNATAS